ncbi:hypothetical protein C3B59_05145 [Cryobacterium zongtaii]|uniref:O-antigen ligase-related domain-containing protein n=1 Tax=Cryobacterium zongtaii TaxID=1259217 RepID=A0A2S3ZM15_9MICO|nr:O-antigen ligase family protein [Cryobacterium zongtaii]POH69732.1 hypothetical protein C3B59_05145 [Cryobacterium zongtaii]
MLASVVLLPGALDRWFLPKDTLAAVAVLVASLAAAQGRLPRWFVLGSVIAALLALAAVLLSAAPATQFWGRWPRYEGIVALPVYFGAVWAGARLLGTDAPPDRLRTLARAVATASIALGAVSAVEALGARPFASDLARPGALTGNATDQGLLGAMFLALLALPVLRAWGGTPGITPGSGRARQDTVRSEVERAWLTVGLLFAVVTVVLSVSRAGLLAAGVATVGLTVLTGLRVSAGRVRWVLLGGGGGIALLAIGALVVPFTRDRLLGASPLAGHSLEARFDYWRQGLDLLTGHPLGVGASGFLNANAGSSATGSTLDSPHNWLLQVALAGGLPLLAVVLAVLVATGWLAVRRWWRLIAVAQPAARAVSTGHADLLVSALAGLAGYGMALLTHFTAPSTAIPAALLLGVLVAVPAGGRARAREVSLAARRALGGLRTALLVGWVASMILVTSAEVPLASAVDAAGNGDLAAAEAAFLRAQGLRPWDADLASIAAQSFAALADGGVAEAAPLAVDWAERSRAVLPNTVATERALAVGQLNVGDIAGAARTLEAVARLAPRDAGIAAQYAVVLYLHGETALSRAQVDRALEIDPTFEVALRLRDVLDEPRLASAD